jgi:hypothetical protein
MVHSSGFISLIVFLCSFLAALAGVAFGKRMPQQHLDDASKDVVRGGMAVVATMVALVLGLLIASAKGYYDTQSAELTGMSANAVLLDRMLAHYGAGAGPARALLRKEVATLLGDMDAPGEANLSPANPRVANGEPFYDKLQQLAPKDDEHRVLKAQLLGLAMETAHTRWLMYEQQAARIPFPLIVALTGWLTLIFLSTGVFARPNVMVISSFFASAISVAGAIWLIIEMYSPYSGYIRVTDSALRAALAQLGS